jgi:hypothetical protein
MAENIDLTPSLWTFERPRVNMLAARPSPAKKRRAGEGARTLDIQLGKLALYH